MYPFANGKTKKAGELWLDTTDGDTSVIDQCGSPYRGTGMADEPPHEQDADSHPDERLNDDDLRALAAAVREGEEHPRRWTAEDAITALAVAMPYISCCVCETATAAVVNGRCTRGVRRMYSVEVFSADPRKFRGDSWEAVVTDALKTFGVLSAA